MMKLSNIPLSVLNRALDLYGIDRETTTQAAWDALHSAERRVSVEGPLTPFAQAVGEYISLAGPWAEDGGEYAGESGYHLDTASA